MLFLDAQQKWVNNVKSDLRYLRMKAEETKTTESSKVFWDFSSSPLWFRDTVREGEKKWQEIQTISIYPLMIVTINNKQQRNLAFHSIWLAGKVFLDLGSSPRLFGHTVRKG